MPLDIEHFIKLRPFLYHLTHRGNIQYIKRDKVLKPTNLLYQESGENTLSGTKRNGSRTLKSGLNIRDQDPLHEGNIKFSANWTFAQFISHLDNHVFFWPGWEQGPVGSGMRHFARYASELPVVLRVGTEDLFAENAGASPLFCKYNSGAPRCISSVGEGSPRGPQTFLPAKIFPFAATSVVEVTFKSSVRLPPGTEAMTYPTGQWHLFRDFTTTP